MITYWSILFDDYNKDHAMRMNINYLPITVCLYNHHTRNFPPIQPSPHDSGLTAATSLTRAYNKLHPSAVLSSSYIDSHLPLPLQLHNTACLPKAPCSNVRFPQGVLVVYFAHYCHTS